MEESNEKEKRRMIYALAPSNEVFLLPEEDPIPPSFRVITTAEAIERKRQLDEERRLEELRRTIKEQEESARLEERAMEKTRNLEIKLLTCSPETWAKNQNREITAYELIEIDSGEYTVSISEAKERLRKNGRYANCEAIVNLQVTGMKHEIYLIGTGLRLMKQGEETKVKPGEEI